MSLLRLTVTQLRIGIVGLNFFATVLIAALPAYRLFSPHEPLRQAELKTLMAKKGDDFKPSSRRHKGVNYAISVASVGENFRKNPMPLPTDDSTTDVAEIEKPDEEPRGPDDLPPGPLEEKFEFIGGIFWEHNSVDNIAVLELKEGVNKRPVPRPRRRNTRRPSAARNTRNKVKRSVAKGPRKRNQADNQKLLRVYQRWVVDEEEGPAIFVLSVTPEKFTYEEQGKWVRYALKRKRDSIYEFDPEDQTYLVEKKEEDEEEAPVDGDAKGEEEPKKHFYVNHAPRTSREAFDKRKREHPDVFEKEEEAPAAQPTGAKGRRGARAPSRLKRTTPVRAPVKKPSKKDLKEFRETLKQIPAKDRKELENALKKGTSK